MVQKDVEGMNGIGLQCLLRPRVSVPILCMNPYAIAQTHLEQSALNS